MSTSTQKSNIGTFLLILTVLAFIFIIALVAKSMITDGIPAGKYKNPNVATYIVEGSIYDINGRTLSLEVPTYNCYFDRTKMNSAQLEQAIETIAFYSNITAQDIKNKLDSTYKSYLMVSNNIDENAIEELNETIKNYNLQNAVIIEKAYTRRYPAIFHAAQLVAEVENNMASVISPKPGYNTATTYGENIYLTIDLDVQYILDLAVQDLNRVIPSEYVYAFVINADTGALLATSTYPFYDLNQEELTDSQKQNKALLSIFEGIIPYFVDKITDKNGNIIFAANEYDTSKLNFTRDVQETIESLNSPLNSVIKAVPELEKPKYYIVVGVVNPNSQIESDYINNTAEYIYDGLRSQSKI